MEPILEGMLTSHAAIKLPLKRETAYAARRISS